MKKVYKLARWSGMDEEAAYRAIIIEEPIDEVAA